MKENNRQAYSLGDAKMSLQEYVGKSWWDRASNLHWNHHHIPQVESILSDENIDTLAKLILRLDFIQLVNNNGALANIIRGIKTAAGIESVGQDASWVQKVITIFLNYFNYLNLYKKRHGIHFWLNTDLTNALENQAGRIISQLNQMMNNSVLPEDEQFEDFIKIIRKTMHAAWRDRFNNGSENIYLSYSSFDRMTGLDRNPMTEPTSVTTYKVAYGAGKFEDEVLNGLTKIKEMLLDDGIENHDKNAKIDALIAEIKDYESRNEMIGYIDNTKYRR